jgi:hypothetical protein
MTVTGCFGGFFHWIAKLSTKSAQLPSALRQTTSKDVGNKIDLCAVEFHTPFKIKER